jgi:hypothetical protein
MAKIFISYRREDSSEFAGRLYEYLRNHFHEEQVYMDVLNTPKGSDFRKVIEDNLISCAVLVAVIGKKWLTVEDRDGQRRLDGEDDYVRLEIATVLERGIRVIPLLLDGAELPSPDELPGNLRGLVYRQAQEVKEEDFNDSVGQLCEELEANIGSAELIESKIANRSYDLKLFDILPSFLIVILKKLGIDRRFFTTLKTLCLSPSQIRYLHLPYFSRPLEFLSTCVILEVGIGLLVRAFLVGDIQRLSIVDLFKGYVELLVPILIWLPINVLLPNPYFFRTPVSIGFTTRLRYYCYVAGWVEIINTAVFLTKYLVSWQVHSLSLLGEAGYWVLTVLTIIFKWVFPVVPYLEGFRVTIAIFYLKWPKSPGEPIAETGPHSATPIDSRKPMLAYVLLIMFSLWLVFTWLMVHFGFPTK